MARITVSLPEGLKRWIETRMAEGRWTSISEYICDLIRRDMEVEEARRGLQAAIDGARASGVSDRTIGGDHR